MIASSIVNTLTRFTTPVRLEYPCMYSLCLAACTSGFIGLETLVGLTTFTRLIGNGQSIYPAINFTCDGSITSWTVLRRRFTGSNDTLYPDLQVWRGEGGRAYTRVGNTTLSGGSDNEDDIYEYMLDNPLKFQAGDVFGKFQPLESVSRLMIIIFTLLWWNTTFTLRGGRLLQSH